MILLLPLDSGAKRVSLAPVSRSECIPMASYLPTHKVSKIHEFTFSMSFIVHTIQKRTS